MASVRAGLQSRHGVAVLVLALALGLWLLLRGNPFPLLLAAVTLASLYGGLRLGLEVIVLILALGVLGSRYRAPAPRPAAATRMGLINFVVLGLFIAGLTEALHAARRRAEQDAEARKQSEERYSLAMRGSRESLWDWDLRDDRVFRSHRLEELIGPAGEGRESMLEILSSRLHEEDREPVLTALRGHLDGRVPFDVECRLKTVYGKYRWVHASGQATWDESGRPIRMAGALGDITSRKESEAALREAKEAAEAAARAKDRFLAMLSHELRTPLTPALIGVSGVLEDHDLPDSLRPTLEAARRGILLEAHLVDDLLDMTRIGAGKLRMTPERVDAHAIIHDTLGVCREDIERAGLTVKVDLGAVHRHVVADPARLQQVLWNLIKNATKFTLRHGTLTIRTMNRPPCPCDDQHVHLLVEVIDDGIGIDPGFLPRIFEAFEQGEMGGLGNPGGLGLGLAISRYIAEAHGGQLRASSGGLGQGTTFTLELNAASDSSQAATQSEVPQDAGGSLPLRILLVEDDRDTGQVIARLLRRRGADVTIAESVAAARAAAASAAFDLLLSDIGLPDGTGIELLEWLRARQPIPAIALTGYGMEEDIERCRDAGFAAHLTKPVDFRDLEQAIRRATSRLDRV
jgi:PAS domain S-box-containing protein